jgi:phosphoribosylformimino-5-aminoimidazole carboxamide ribotide isomerase
MAGDPETLVAEWLRLGFARMHLHDLDAQAGDGTNEALIADLIRRSGIDVQVGGGMEDASRVATVLDSGARWAVLDVPGGASLDEAAELANSHPDAIIVAVEVKHGRLVARPGSFLPDDAADLTGEVAGLPLAGLLVRCSDREGHPAGPDLRTVEDVVETSDVPVLVEGGVASIAHLRSLEDRGASCVVLGAPLIDGTVSAASVAALYGS